ncbi:MAG: selenocysteine-specific translation elongation factor [Bacteroidales bacterium]
MKHFIIGTAGHVDHGKTALIKALTNIDCDTHREEKERGITINLGFAHLDLPSGESVGIVDVPGHKDFIKTMIAGAYGVDIILLVVAADSGIMPQTEEHLQIIEMLGVKLAIVALTKADLVDEETLELAHLEIAEFIEGKAIGSAPIIPVSSLTGEGVGKLVETISEILLQVNQRPVTDLFRMYIDRLFSVKGLGFVVTGSVLEGKTEAGNELFLLPGKNKKVRVRSIERHGKTVNQVYGGDRAAMNLTGLKAEDFSRGMVLSNHKLVESSMVDATLTLFTKTPVLKVWSTVVFYSGTFESGARLHLIDQDSLKPGRTAIVQIHLSKPAILVNKDKFIIRNSSNTTTLGGGSIIDTQPLHHKKRSEKLILQLKELADATLQSHQIINLIKIELKKANTPVFASRIAAILSKTPEEIMEACAAENQKSVKVFHGSEASVLITAEHHQTYRDAILDEITRWHHANPILEEGLSKEFFVGKFNFGKNEAGKFYLDWLIRYLFIEGNLMKAGNSYALPGHVVKIDTRTEEQLHWLEQTIQNIGLEKPVPAEIEEMAHLQRINKERLKMLLKYLGKEDKLVFYDGDYIHRSVVDRCRSLLLRKIAFKADGINEKEFRELINGTRKLTQMLLGIFIQEGLVEKKTFYIMITEKGRNHFETIKDL